MYSKVKVTEMKITKVSKGHYNTTVNGQEIWIDQITPDNSNKSYWMFRNSDGTVKSDGYETKQDTIIGLELWIEKGWL